MIDWGELKHALKDVHSNREGASAWPPLLMLKALLLQSWYNLSDPALEKQLARDLLFRRFTGLGMGDAVPDHSTIWRFRNLLEKLGLFERLLEIINQQLTTRGVLIRQGEVSIIDASVIEANRCRPRKGKRGNNTQDPEAGYNVKRSSDGKQKTTYGYSMHVNVDEDALVKKCHLTAGNVHDSQGLNSVVTGTEVEICADSAYSS